MFHHIEIRQQLPAKATILVGSTYGNIHISYHPAPLTLSHTDVKPSYGSKPLDVIAVREDQMSWGEDIKHCPVELLTFYPPGAENISKIAIEHLKYDGKSVVDFRTQHLKDFPSLPLGIYSMVEGWRIESWMRSDIRMTMTDILARILVE